MATTVDLAAHPNHRIAASYIEIQRHLKSDRLKTPPVGGSEHRRKTTCNKAPGPDTLEYNYSLDHKYTKEDQAYMHMISVHFLKQRQDSA